MEIKNIIPNAPESAVSNLNSFYNFLRYFILIYLNGEP